MQKTTFSSFWILGSLKMITCNLEREEEGSKIRSQGPPEKMTFCSKNTLKSVAADSQIRAAGYQKRTPNKGWQK